MKRRILLAAALAFLTVPLVGAMSAPFRAPDSAPGIPVSLPFPMTNAPVRITDASLVFAWGEIDDYGTMSCEYTAEYTIQYTGADPMYIEVAVPFIGTPDNPWYSPKITVDQRSEAYRTLFSLLETEYRVIHEPEDWDEFSLKSFIDDIQLQSEPYTPKNSDADTPAVCYALVVSIPFEVGQERVLSIYQNLRSGKLWYEEDKQSLLYCPILTEGAGYWSSFGLLSIVTTYPAGIFEPVMSRAFDYNEDYYSLRLNYAPEENLYIGFRVPDERKAESSLDFGYILMSIVFLTLAYWPVTLLLIILVILLVSYRRYRRILRDERENPENEQPDE